MIVIDDFYEDPILVRNQALGFKYYPQDKVYPGRISVEQYLIDSQKPKFSEAIGNPVGPIFGALWGRFRSTLADDTASIDVHVDVTLPSDWNIVIYMNLPHQCQGGTQLFKHIETGETELKDKTMYDKFIEDGMDRTKWEVIDETEMKFNRAVIFSSLKFHSYSSLFGDMLENGRLTQLFFVDDK